MSKCCRFLSWRTAFHINLKISDFICYVSSPTLLLQYVISLSQKKPGLKEDKEIGYSQCLFIHLKSLHELQRGQIIIWHFLYAVNRWVFFLLLLLFCFVLSVVRNFCFVLSFVVVIFPGSSLLIFIVVQDHMFPCIAIRMNFTACTLLRIYLQYNKRTCIQMFQRRAMKLSLLLNDAVWKEEIFKKISLLLSQV